MIRFAKCKNRRKQSHSVVMSAVEVLERRDLLTTLAWSAGPNLPAPRTDAVAVVTPDNAVRLLGGDADSPTAALLLTANGTSWTKGFKIDTERNDLGAVRSENAVFLFGGTEEDEGNDFRDNLASIPSWYEHRIGQEALTRLSTSPFSLTLLLPRCQRTSLSRTPPRRH